MKYAITKTRPVIFSLFWMIFLIG